MDHLRVTPVRTMPGGARLLACPSMRIVRLLGLSSVVALALASQACTGDEPVVCGGASCGEPTPTPTASGFELSVAGDLTILAGAVTDVVVEVKRTAFEGAIVVGAKDLPANVSAGALTIPPGATTGKLTLTALPNARHGVRPVTITGADVDAKTTRTATTKLLVRDRAGALDNSFGDDGRVEIPGGVSGTALSALAVDGAGRVYASGSTEKNFMVARLASDGKLDTTFGTQGRAIGNLRSEDGTDEIGESSAIGAHGEIVVGGYATSMTPGSDFELARFDSAGKIDPGFGTAGFFASKYTGGPIAPEQVIEISMRGAAVQASDGKVVFAGWAAENKGYPDFVKHAVVARLTEAGKLDAAFGGGDGWIERITGSTASETCNAVAIASANGAEKVVCAGSTQPADGTGTKTFFVWRSNADGGQDAAFGYNGVGKIAYGPTAVAGEAQSVHTFGDKTIVTGTSGEKAIVVRLDAKGDTDAGFAGGQAVTLDALGALVDKTTRSVVDASGNVTVATTTGAGDFDIAVARVLANGAPDGKLGDAGRAIVKLGAKGAINGARIAVMADGRILVATTLSGRGIVVFRLWG